MAAHVVLCVCAEHILDELFRLLLAKALTLLLHRGEMLQRLFIVVIGSLLSLVHRRIREGPGLLPPAFSLLRLVHRHRWLQSFLGHCFLFSELSIGLHIFDVELLLLLKLIKLMIQAVLDSHQIL